MQELEAAIEAIQALDDSLFFWDDPEEEELGALAAAVAVAALRDLRDAEVDLVCDLALTTKQLVTRDLDPDRAELLDRCFPGFRGWAETAKWLNEGRIELEVTSKGTFTTTSGRMRRFAGDLGLGPGSYATVCQDRDDSSSRPPDGTRMSPPT